MINHFDLAFVVDTTSSMGNLIKVAQRQMVDMIDALATRDNIDMRLGVVSIGTIHLKTGWSTACTA